MGLFPTVTVLTILLFLVSRTETRAEPLLAMYTCLPSSVTARPSGATPAGTVAATL